MLRRVMVAALCAGGGIAVLAVSSLASASSPSAPPSVAGLLFGWWPDVVFGSAAVVLAALYLVGARRVPGWPRGRTAVWLLGCAVVLVATPSGIGRYAPVMVSMLVASQALLAGVRRCCWCSEVQVTTWLHRIVVNACLDRLRRRQARPTVPLPETETDPVDPPQTETRTLARKTDRTEITALLEQSSLGTDAAQSLRSRATPIGVDRILQRAKELAPTRDPLLTPTPVRFPGAPVTPWPTAKPS